MFDPSKATKDKALKQLKKRATSDVRLWAEKRIPDSVKDGKIHKFNQNVNISL